ncbi:MAG: NDP-sugar synthase [Elusimicrobia bacterium]|nr:NDP-sugar synthase [Elusimicrobiota bacterium]
MQAVILIGGMGTRLRPLTCDTPKPLLPVLNRPFLHYQFEILKAHGIKDILLCTSYQAKAFEKILGNGRSLGVRLRYLEEKHPLGTGGALRNAVPLLRKDSTVLALNGDVLNTLDITKLLKQHRKTRAKLTIALTRVKDPTAYGLVIMDQAGRIRKFLEKPSWDEIESNTVNAGAYLFDPAILDAVPPNTHYSLERSLFPMLLQNGSPLYGFVTNGYWIDIGTIDKYLQAHLDILGGATPFRARGAKGQVLLGRGTSVGDFVRFEGHVCVGNGCRVGKGAWLQDCVVLEGTVIGDGARLERCVVGARCRIGTQAVLGQGTALAGGSELKPYTVMGSRG